MFRMPKLVPAALLVAHLGCWAVGATTAAATAGSIIDGATAPAVVHVWEPVEVTLAASSAYANPYTDCEIWAELTGPGGFGTKRVYGFWDGNHTFKIRMVATDAGRWTYKTGSQPHDVGLADHEGSWAAEEWSEADKLQNPNRKGFLRHAPGGHALMYADGSPFFAVGDTWWAASTRRFPWADSDVSASPEILSPNISFQAAVQYRKAQRFNVVMIISAYPNWNDDGLPAHLVDSNGNVIRQAWQSQNGSAEAMPDEYGNRPFGFPGRTPNHQDVNADYDKLNPVYFRSLDRKMQYLSSQGFVPWLSTIRRDQTQTWHAYYNFTESFGRYVTYITARYGCFSVMFSHIHADTLADAAPVEAFREALNAQYRKYGPPPFGQPASAEGASSTAVTFGHGATAPWLTLDSCGNGARNRGMYPNLLGAFELPQPNPVFNNEPYYNCAPHFRLVAGEDPGLDTPRNAYFTRANAYGSVLNGGLAGQMYGAGGWAGHHWPDTPENASTQAGRGLFVWDALGCEASSQLQYLSRFVLSGGTKSWELRPASALLRPQNSSAVLPDNLDGSGHMMLTSDAALALLYFENRAPRPRVVGLRSSTLYCGCLLNPRTGVRRRLWTGGARTGGDGSLLLPLFPGGRNESDADWAVALTVGELCVC